MQLPQAKTIQGTWKCATLVLLIPSIWLSVLCFGLMLVLFSSFLSAPSWSGCGSLLFCLAGSAGMVALWLSALADHGRLSENWLLFWITVMGLAAGILVELTWLPPLVSMSVRIRWSDVWSIWLMFGPLPVGIVNLTLLVRRRLKRRARTRPTTDNARLENGPMLFAARRPSDRPTVD